MHKCRLSRIRGPISVSSFIVHLLHCRPLIFFCAHGIYHDGPRVRVCSIREIARPAHRKKDARRSFRIVFLIFTSASRGEGGREFLLPNDSPTPPPFRGSKSLGFSGLRFSLVCCERAGPSLVDDHGVCVYVLVAVSRRHQAVILYTNIIKFYHYNIGSLFFFSH